MNSTYQTNNQKRRDSMKKDSHSNGMTQGMRTFTKPGTSNANTGVFIFYDYGQNVRYEALRERMSIIFP